MTVYKIVRLENDERFTSSFINGRVLDYRVGTKTVPVHGDGPLAAFASMDDARRFMNRKGWSFHELRVFMARAVVDKKNVLLWYSTACGDKRVNSGLTHGLPRGTVFCKSITLLEEVPF